MSTTDDVVVHYGCEFPALQLFIPGKVLKISKFTLDCIMQYIAVL